MIVFADREIHRGFLREKTAGKSGKICDSCGNEENHEDFNKDNCNSGYVYGSA